MFAKLISLVLAPLLIVAPVMATDLPSRTARPALPLISTPAANWAGPYIGITAGYGLNSSNYTEASDPNGSTSLHFDQPKERASDSGMLIGMKAGYDWQYTDNIVIGALADFSYSNISSKTCILNCGNSNEASYVSNDLNWLGTLRARIGYENRNTLYYVSGGAAFAQSAGVFRDRLLGFGGGPVIDFATHQNLLGYTLGGGVELKFTTNVSFDAEYLYVRLNDKRYQFIPNDSSETSSYFMNVDNNINLVRGSLNYHF